MVIDNYQSELTAYCGLYCGDCLRFASKIPDLAGGLKAELSKMKFGHYAVAKSKKVTDFKYYQYFLQVIDAIIKLKCSIPCRNGGDGCIEACEIKTCVRSKAFKGCWDCEKFEICEKFEFLKSFSGDSPKKNAKIIREYGLDKWVEHRSEFYSWL